VPRGEFEVEYIGSKQINAKIFIFLRRDINGNEDMNGSSPLAYLLSTKEEAHSKDA
jgi:hypothetical protein